MPVLIIMGLGMDANPLISIIIVGSASFTPTIIHAVVFVYIWNWTASLAVVAFYHVCFDEVRDASENTVGLGVLGQNWQSLILTILGIWFYIKGMGVSLKPNATDIDHGNP